MSGRGRGGMGLGAMRGGLDSDYDSEEDESYFSDQEKYESFSEDEDETIGSSRKKRSFEEPNIQDAKIENKKGKKSRKIGVEEGDTRSGKKNDPVDLKVWLKLKLKIRGNSRAIRVRYAEKTWGVKS